MKVGCVLVVLLSAFVAVKIFSDRVPARNAVATVIPIKGDLTDSNVQLWPTIFGVVRNAFLEGLISGFAHLPPDTAPGMEGAAKPDAKPTTPEPAP